MSQRDLPDRNIWNVLYLPIMLIATILLFLLVTAAMFVIGQGLLWLLRELPIFVPILDVIGISALLFLVYRGLRRYGSERKAPQSHGTTSTLAQFSADGFDLRRSSSPGEEGPYEIIPPRPRQNVSPRHDFRDRCRESRIVRGYAALEEMRGTDADQATNPVYDRGKAKHPEMLSEPGKLLNVFLSSGPRKRF